MTKLSPAAEAVLDAAYRRMDENPHNEVEATIAAALRATADQVVPEEPAPKGMRPAGEVYSAREIKRRQRQDVRSELLAIADELEAQ